MTTTIRCGGWSAEARDIEHQEMIDGSVQITVEYADPRGLKAPSMMADAHWWRIEPGGTKDFYSFKGAILRHDIRIPASGIHEGTIVVVVDRPAEREPERAPADAFFRGMPA